MFRLNSRVLAGLIALGLTAAESAVAADEIVLSPEVQQAFERSGWNAQRAEDGSLILRPAERAAPAAAPAPAAEQTKTDVWDRLRDQGWRVEEGANGSRLLYPPAAKESTAAPPSQPPGPAEAGSSGAESLEEALNRLGWRAQRSPDGSLILRPGAVGSDTGAASQASIEPAPGFVPSDVQERAIELPLDQESDVRRIVRTWLDVFGRGEMTAGRIRKVLRVYVVSIVDRDPPHRLRHQIAVNAEDGRVVVLN